MSSVENLLEKIVVWSVMSQPRAKWSAYANGHITIDISAEIGQPVQARSLVSDN